MFIFSKKIVNSESSFASNVTRRFLTVWKAILLHAVFNKHFYKSHTHLKVHAFRERLRVFPQLLSADKRMNLAVGRRKRNWRLWLARRRPAVCGRDSAEVRLGAFQLGHDKIDDGPNGHGAGHPAGPDTRRSHLLLHRRHWLLGDDLHFLVSHLARAAHVARGDARALWRIV